MPRGAIRQAGSWPLFLRRKVFFVADDSTIFSFAAFRKELAQTFFFRHADADDMPPCQRRVALFLRAADDIPVSLDFSTHTPRAEYAVSFRFAPRALHFTPYAALLSCRRGTPYYAQQRDSEPTSRKEHVEMCRQWSIPHQIYTW